VIHKFRHSVPAGNGLAQSGQPPSSALAIQNASCRWLVRQAELFASPILAFELPRSASAKCCPNLSPAIFHRFTDTHPRDRHIVRDQSFENNKLEADCIAPTLVCDGLVTRRAETLQAKPLGASLYIDTAWFQIWKVEMGWGSLPLCSSREKGRS